MSTLAKHHGLAYGALKAGSGLRCFVLVAALFVLAVAPAAAHPHVFIHNTMAVDFEHDKLAGIEVNWVFDELFSELVLVDFKPDAEGHYTDKSATEIKKRAFDNLKNYHYFLGLSLDGVPIRKFSIERFVPSVENNKHLLAYSFFVRLDIPVSKRNRTLSITVYDDTYYVAFDLMHAEEIALKGTDGLEVSRSIEKSTVKAVWPGQYMPDNVVIRFKVQ